MVPVGGRVTPEGGIGVIVDVFQGADKRRCEHHDTYELRPDPTSPLEGARVSGFDDGAKTTTKTRMVVIPYYRVTKNPPVTGCR